MKYVLSAVIGFIAAGFLYLFNRSGRILDNGSRANGIRNGLDASADRAKTIADSVASAASSVERASSGVDKALDIISKIRKRGATKQDTPDSGTDSD